MRNYSDQYLKYKYKNFIGSGKNEEHKTDELGELERTYDIIFLWINKKKQEIPPEIKSKLLTKMNIWRTQNKNKIYLYVDKSTMIPEEIEELENYDKNIFTLKDINEMKVINEKKYLLELYNYFDNIYMKVDFVKILIQYEHLRQTETRSKNFYVVFTDLDILTENEEPTRLLNCNDENMMKNFTDEEIFDSDTIKLLDNFGFIMGKIGREFRIGKPENNFMIAKKDPNVILAFEEYWINGIFDLLHLNYVERNLFVSTAGKTPQILKENNHTIFEFYGGFNFYLNMMMGLSIISVGKLEITNQNSKKLWEINKNNNFILFDITKSWNSIPAIAFNDWIVGSKYTEKAENFKNEYEAKQRIYTSGYMAPAKCVKIEITTTHNI